MSLTKLALRGIRFHWRSYTGVFLGCAIATAILVGALAVGDSVRFTLRRMALQRVGDIQLALVGESRFFRSRLANEVESRMKAPVAPAILIRGLASLEDARVNGVQVLGVDSRFWSLSPSRRAPNEAAGVVLNRRLAALLNARRGQEALLRVDKPSLLSRDAPLSTVEDSTVTVRLPITDIVDDAQFGRFSLAANQTPPLNAFVPLDLLANRIGMGGRANCLFVAGRQGGESAAARAAAALWEVWQPADASLKLRELPKRGEIELRTDRVFLDPPVGDAALRAYPGASGALTYFVNELRVGSRTTPYSTVAALQSSLIPSDMRSDEILINAWLAEDLHAKIGDTLALKYWIVGPMRKLTERSSQFRIRGILPMSGSGVDPALMPDIPGLSDKNNCREWEPGVPVDLNRIRDKDQAYWDTYRGSPKAFIQLSAGHKIWQNRFGSLTTVRYREQGASKERIASCIKQALTPAALGLFFQPIRERAIAATSPTLDFGQLFLGFSFFLIVAALILTALLFGFAVEQRSHESGILLASGFHPRVVRRLFLLEALGIAIMGALAGSMIALLYTRVVIDSLSGKWSAAVAGAALEFYVEPITIIGGAVGSALIAMVTVWIVARRQVSRSARELLAESPEPSAAAASTGRVALAVSAVSGTIGLALAAIGLIKGTDSAIGIFFGAGFLLLVSGTAACRSLLSRMEGRTDSRRFSISSLSARNSSRRYGRTVAAVALLASGSFLVIAVGANRHDPLIDSSRRSSGTGGFALYSESATPIFHDLNTSEGLEKFGLERADVEGAKFVSLRVKDGDDASCLNLNRAITPRLLAVDPAALGGRGAFQFVKSEGESNWNLLSRPLPNGEIPAVGDVNTVTWSLGKGLGETVEYQDERGRKQRLRIVGVLANSILQGSLVISEDRFTQIFPSESGYRAFLIDAPAVRSGDISRELVRATEDVGLSITPAWERMAAFSAVENTYLSIFAVLGTLGLLLGSAGLGVIVLRNVLDRRGELAILGAVGFRRVLLHRLIFTEHAVILGLGLAVGVTSALIAVLPTIAGLGSGSPLAGVLLSLPVVLVSGLFWTWIATTLSLRGSLISALRND